MEKTGSESLLGGLRVLDLTDDKGLLAAKILADFGADVIQVEPPGGNEARKIGPFYHDNPDPEKSLFWFAYSVNKRGITLDIKKAEGQKIFKRLVKTAHFVIESFAPDYLDKLGLGYSELSRVNSSIILTSITPFGELEPYKEFKGPDIVVMAMGGYMHLTGDSDRPPLRISAPQAYLLAAERAAAGTMVAHYHREVTGEGQHVKVNALASVWPIGLNAIPFWVVNKTVLRRSGAWRVGLSTSAKQRQIWACKDGFVSFSTYGADLAARNIPPLLNWIEREGMADARSNRLKDVNWAEFSMSEASQELFDLMSECMGDFFLRHTKKELYEGAVERGIMLYPVYSPREILEDRQLEARQYWIQLDHPQVGTSFRYPGAFVKFSQTPCSIERRAPLIGEHNREVYEQELGLSTEALIRQGVI